MHVFEISPARRKGEVNFADIGYDWGEFSHILPGRRTGEPNHHAWKNRLSGHDKSPVRGNTPDHASDWAMIEQYEQATQAVSKTIDSSVDVLKSVVEMMTVLEGIRSVRNENMRAASFRKEAVGTEIKTDEQKRAWSLDLTVQVHNMCVRQQMPKPTHDAVTRRYDVNTEPEHDILPPLKTHKETDH